MRQLIKQWKNKRSGFTHRIRWYEARFVSSIRLCIDTPDGESNVYPDSKEAAQRIWDEFKTQHSEGVAL